MATTRLLSAMVATWNNAAATFTGLKLNVTDTASASGSLLMDLQVGGASKFTLSKAGYGFFQSSLETGANLNVSTNSGLIRLGASSDVILARDAANTLALRNGTAAQTFNLYETYTDASNYSRMAVGYGVVGAGYYSIQTQAGGTGTNRNFLFDAAGGLSRLSMNTSGFVFGSSTNDWWKITSAGHFIAAIDNTYDIGASGANRPRSGYFGTNVTVGNALVLGAGVGQIVWNGRAQLTSPADAVLRLNNAAATITTDITLSGASSTGTSTATFGGSIVSGGNVQAVSAGGFSWLGGKGGITQATDGVYTFANNAGSNSVALTVGAANLLTLNGGLKTTGATFALQTATTLTDNAAAQVATMTNGPTAGNPTKWIAINDNGVTRYIPAW